MAKGKLPLTGKIELLSNESQWSMLARGLVNDLPSQGIISLANDRKVKINIVFEIAAAPEDKKWNTVWKVLGDEEDRERGEGLARAMDFFLNMLSDDIWAFKGFIAGEKRVPIVIIYHVALNIAIYSQKPVDQSSESFFPKHLLN